LTLKKLSARDIMAEFKGAYRHKVLSLSAVKKWRRRLVNKRIILKDDLRSGRPPRSGLYESLWALVDEAPFISCKGMCQKLLLPKATCLRVLQEVLGFRKYYLGWVPHSMTENEAQCQVTFLRNLFGSCAMPKGQTSNIY
jgi:hypothetical protein